MPAPDLRARLKRDEPFFFGWAAQPGTHHAAAMARLPFEGVCLDMQHGLIGFAEMAAMVPAINAAGKASIVRVVWNEAGPVGQALDAGATSIIAPMINTAGDAERLVRYAKYPPMGGRSWGSYALTQYEGMTKEKYLSEGNRLSFVFAMVETQEALDNLDAICAVPGIDGIFVGPSDLTISLSRGKSVDYGFDKTQAALAHIAKTAKAHDLAAGVFGGAAEFVRSCISKGFRFISSSADTVLMDAGAKVFLAAVKA